jgi:hypothetical protein
MLAVDVVEEAGLVAIEACDADEVAAIFGNALGLVLVLTDVNMPAAWTG